MAGGWATRRPLLAKDHVLVNFNFHTVEKHMVQANGGPLYSEAHKYTSTHTCSPAALGADSVSRWPRAERHRGGEAGSVLASPPPIRTLPLPAGPWSPPGGQAASQTLCSWPVSLPPRKVNLITSHRVGLGSQGTSPRGLLWARSPHLMPQGGQTRPPSRSSRLAERQPWSFTVVGTVASGAGAGRPSSGRTGWGTDLSR